MPGFFTRLLPVLSVIPLFLPHSSHAGDWPNLQGPHRDGQSDETGLAASWGEQGPGTLWTAKVSAGYGGAAIRDGQVYLLDRVDHAQDVLRCWELETGEELWSYAYDAPGKTGHSGSRTPPTVDEDYVFTVGLMGDLHCIDRKTHQPVWNKNLLSEYQVEGSPSWGISQSPVRYKDLVVVAAQGPEVQVAALDRATGKEVWTSPSQGRLGYSSPVVATLCGVDQVVMISASKDEGEPGGPIVGISAEDGRVLWSYVGWSCKIPIPFAAALPGDRLFITGGYDAGSAMLQVAKTGDAFEIKELFRIAPTGSQLHQPLLIDGHLYMNSNSNDHAEGMICMNLDGRVIWKTSDNESLPQFERGNLIYADGKIYNLDGKTGILHLIQPSPEGYKELDRAEVLDSQRMWSPLALSNGRIVLRGQDTLKCLDVSRR